MSLFISCLHGLMIVPSHLLQQIFLYDTPRCTGACSAAVYQKVYKTAAGNAIVAMMGTVPGYFFTIAFVDVLGRIPIQFAGGRCQGLSQGWVGLGLESKLGLGLGLGLGFGLGLVLCLCLGSGLGLGLGLVCYIWAPGTLRQPGTDPDSTLSQSPPFVDPAPTRCSIPRRRQTTARYRVRLSMACVLSNSNSSECCCPTSPNMRAHNRALPLC